MSGRRLLAMVGATLALAAALPAGVPAAAALPAGATAAGDGQAEVPRRLHDPWLWQATVGQRPVGPATVVFHTDQTRYFESTGVLVGRDGGYRLLYQDIGEDDGLLSPDGRHYLRPGRGTLIDLTTGDERPTHPRGIRALAWSPDGRTVLGTRDNDDAVITYGPDGQALNDPAHPDTLVTVDPFSGAERRVDPGPYASHAAGAWSPDGALVAVAGPPDEAAVISGRQRLTVLDPATGRVSWRVDLDERHALAGRGAWSPDGRRVALLAVDGCTTRCRDDAELVAQAWRLEFLDAATGRPVGIPVPVDGLAEELLGWQGADPVVERHSRDEDSHARHTEIVAVGPGAGERVLVTAPAASTGIEIPGQLLTRAAYGQGEPRPSPWAAPYWLYGVLLVVPGLAAALIVWWRRRRRPAPADPVATAD